MSVSTTGREEHRKQEKGWACTRSRGATPGPQASFQQAWQIPIMTVINETQQRGCGATQPAGGPRRYPVISSAWPPTSAATFPAPQQGRGRKRGEWPAQVAAPPPDQHPQGHCPHYTVWNAGGRSDRRPGPHSGLVSDSPFPKSFVGSDTLSFVSPNRYAIRCVSLNWRALFRYTDHAMAVHLQQPRGARPSLPAERTSLLKTRMTWEEGGQVTLLRAHCPRRKGLSFPSCTPQGRQPRAPAPHALHSAPKLPVQQTDGPVPS